MSLKGRQKMKIAISTENGSMDGSVDPRFGRAVGFMIYDEATGEHCFIDNAKNLNAAQGAGIQAAQGVVDADVGAVITGYCGPKAYKVLESAGVKIYTCEKVSVREALEKFRNKELTEQVKDF